MPVPIRKILERENDSGNEIGAEDIRILECAGGAAAFEDEQFRLGNEVKIGENADRSRDEGAKCISLHAKLGAMNRPFAEIEREAKAETMR